MSFGKLMFKRILNSFDELAVTTAELWQQMLFTSRIGMGLKSM